MQEAGQEHDRAMRQARAKLQRAEADARAAKQAAAAAAARAAELETAGAQKDVQLDAAVQQVRWVVWWHCAGGWLRRAAAGQLACAEAHLHVLLPAVAAAARCR